MHVRQAYVIWIILTSHDQQIMKMMSGPAGICLADMYVYSEWSMCGSNMLHCKGKTDLITKNLCTFFVNLTNYQGSSIRTSTLTVYRLLVFLSVYLLTTQSAFKKGFCTTCILHMAEQSICWWWPLTGRNRKTIVGACSLLILTVVLVYPPCPMRPYRWLFYITSPVLHLSSCLGPISSKGHSTTWNGPTQRSKIC
jgi:hypothetical protein